MLITLIEIAILISHGDYIDVDATDDNDAHDNVNNFNYYYLNEKDDAVWAKARLSEMIALLNSSRDDWRASALKVHEINSRESRGAGYGPWTSDSTAHTPRRNAEGGLGKYQDKECKNISKYSDGNRHEQEDVSKGVSGGYSHDTSVQGSEVDGTCESVCGVKKEESTRIMPSADEDDNEYSLDFEEAPFKSGGGGGTDSERSMTVNKMEGVRHSVRARTLCSTRYSRNSDENSDGGSYGCDNSRKDDVSVGDVSVEKRVVTSSESSSSSSPDYNVSENSTAVNRNDDNNTNKMYLNSKNGDMNCSIGSRKITENGGHNRFGNNDNHNHDSNDRKHGNNSNVRNNNYKCNNNIGNNNNQNNSSSSNSNINNYNNNSNLGNGNHNYSNVNGSDFDRDRGKDHPLNMKSSSPSLFDMTSPLLNSQVRIVKCSI